MNIRNLQAIVAATAGLAFLIVMVVAGALPEQRQLVRFEARGVMQLEPGRISRVALTRGERKVILLRTPDGGWAVVGGGTLSAETAGKLSLAVQSMNTAGPVRVMQPADYQGASPREFGLDPPRLSLSLFEGKRPEITAHLGARNPEDILQYMTVDGREELFLMSLFVGKQWEAVAGEVLKK